MITLFLLFLIVIAIIAVITYIICFGLGAGAIVVIVIGILVVVGCTIAGIIKLISKRKKQNDKQKPVN